MVKKLLIWIIVLSLLSSFTIGITDDDILDYAIGYFRNNNTDVLGKAPDLTVSGSPNNVACKLGTCYTFDGSDDVLEWPDMNIRQNYTISMWINSDVAWNDGVDYNIVWRWADGGGFNGYVYWSGYACGVRYLSYHGGANRELCIPSSFGQADQWILNTWSFIADTQTIHWWVNDTYQGNQSTTSRNFDNGLSNIDFHIGSKDGGGEHWDGEIDEIIIMNGTWNITKQTYLYNNSHGRILTAGGGGAPSGCTNWTITARGGNYNVSVGIFTANVNGTYHTGTTNTITTGLCIEDANNVYVHTNKTGFYNKSYPLLNTGANVGLTMEQLNFTQYTMWVNSSDWEVGSTFNVHCNYTNPTPFDVTEKYFIKNIDDNTLRTSLINPITIQGEDFLDTLNITCQVNTSYHVNNQSYVKTTETIDDTWTMNVLSYAGDLLSTIFLKIVNKDLNTTVNPYTFSASDILNSTTKQSIEPINVTDLTYTNYPYLYNITFNETIDVYNITMTRNKLRLVFYKDGVLTTTKGYIADQEKAINWTNSSIVIVQQNLTEGYVHVRFGMVNHSNHTQFYEYINDQETHIDENLEILDKADHYLFIQVKDMSGNALEDATIRADFSYHSEDYPNWAYYDTLGQRLTDAQGITWFYLDARSEVLFTIEYSGKATKYVLVTVGDTEYFTRTTPLIVQLLDSEDTTSTSQATLFSPTYINNGTSILTGIITARQASSVTYTTAYRNYMNKSPYDVTSQCDGLDRCPILLRPLIDYNELFGNITLYGYIDGDLMFNKTTFIDKSERTEIVNPNTLWALDKDYTAVVLFILLIGLSSTISFLFTKQDIGIWVFQIGILFLGIYNFWFIVPAGAVAISYTARGVIGLIRK